VKEGRNLSPESAKACAGTFLSNGQNCSALQRRADGVGGAANLRPLAQAYRVEISNFRHNRVLPLHHNAAQLYS
jgi:hypothetical protein